VNKTKLFIIFRYLATGDFYQTLESLFRIGYTTVGIIVKEVCGEIRKVLQPSYMPRPSEETWEKSKIGHKEVI
jgi:hypothetical protein